MISARTAQGYEDFKASTPHERLDIITRWREHKYEYQNSKQNLIDTRTPEGHETGHLSPRGFMQTRHLSFEERKKLHEERKKIREAERTKVQSVDGKRSCPFCRRDKPHMHTPRQQQSTPSVLEPVASHDGTVHSETNEEFEEAIRESVAATSRGDPEEDLMIERAIRASVRELQRGEGAGLSDTEALNRAIQASVKESARRDSQEGEDPEHQKMLEKAIQESLASYSLHGTTGDEAADEHLKLAIQKSKEEADAKPKSEEEIVLEYVKKQSLLEEEHRQKVIGKQREKEDRYAEKGEKDSDADEEALRLALEESVKHSGGEASGS
jgi:hypothetical protein